MHIIIIIISRQLTAYTSFTGIG